MIGQPESYQAEPFVGSMPLYGPPGLIVARSDQPAYSLVEGAVGERSQIVHNGEVAGESVFQ